jgi:hypothetical protein
MIGHSIKDVRGSQAISLQLSLEVFRDHVVLLPAINNVPELAFSLQAQNIN